MSGYVDAVRVSTGAVGVRGGSRGGMPLVVCRTGCTRKDACSNLFLAAAAFMALCFDFQVSNRFKDPALESHMEYMRNV